ncbi:Transposable element Tc3 transposase [Papilio machaon]|uniref:Transposable element Tc3 transposase n=1 Tax=Papilio machaon TaxID=76193 RepID=A0A0N0PF55_PAPMA|nr:Transposable element Tc3 transposase [Papilio machaon]
MQSEKCLQSARLSGACLQSARLSGACREQRANAAPVAEQRASAAPDDEQRARIAPANELVSKDSMPLLQTNSSVEDAGRTSPRTVSCQEKPKCLLPGSSSDALRHDAARALSTTRRALADFAAGPALYCGDALCYHDSWNKMFHRLNARVIDLRLKRCRALLKRYAQKKYREILFSDEKFFSVEESYNKQNDKVYAHSSEEASNSLMVWLGVSYWGLTEVHFCEKGVKTNAVVYQNTVLTNLAEPVSHTMFNNRHWVFQQDSAPAHRAKSIQDWLAAREIDFIRHEDWPSSSPDLNPLDYKIWTLFKNKTLETLNIFGGTLYVEMHELIVYNNNMYGYIIHSLLRYTCQLKFSRLAFQSRDLYKYFDPK